MGAIMSAWGVSFGACGEGGGVTYVDSMTATMAEYGMASSFGVEILGENVANEALSAAASVETFGAATTGMSLSAGFVDSVISAAVQTSESSANIMEAHI